MVDFNINIDFLFTTPAKWWKYRLYFQFLQADVEPSLLTTLSLGVTTLLRRYEWLIFPNRLKNAVKSSIQFLFLLSVFFFFVQFEALNPCSNILLPFSTYIFLFE